MRVEGGDHLESYSPVVSHQSHVVFDDRVDTDQLGDMFHATFEYLRNKLMGCNGLQHLQFSEGVLR